MTFTDLYSILGIILTIVFGYIGIRFAKRQKYPGKIIFIEEYNIGLFDTIIKNFPSIEILYEKKHINEQLVFLKGIFVNSGYIDIKPEMVDENLKIQLPDNFKWINAKIIEVPSQKSNIEILNNSLTFDFGLFRKKEKLHFEAILEVKTDKNPVAELRKNLKFKHRIADTQKVSIEEYVGKNEAINVISGIKAISKLLAIVALFISLFFFAISYLFSDQIYLYETVNEKGDTVKVSVSKSSEKQKFKLEEFRGDFKKEIDFDKLSQLKKLEAIDETENLTFIDRIKDSFLSKFNIVIVIIWVITIINKLFEYRIVKKKVDILHFNS